MKTFTHTLLVIVIIASLAGTGYSIFRARGNADAATTAGLTTSGIPDSPLAPNKTLGVGNEFVTLLLNIRSIKLDSSIFSDKSFRSLQDFSRPIPPDTNPGRPNPFAPLGVDSVGVSTQVSTSNPSSLSATGVTLNGTLVVGGVDIEHWFDYGTTTSLGTETTHKSQQNPGAFAETISGLLPNTVYYAKAVASIGGQIVAGNQVTWKTAQQVQAQTPVKGAR